MAEIEAEDFEANCLQLLDNVATSREPLIVTKSGKPVAMLVPMPPQVKLRGALKGSVLFEGDIVSPLVSEWESVRD